MAGTLNYTTSVTLSGNTANCIYSAPAKQRYSKAACCYAVFMIISVVNTKGGVAKTTTAILLGLALSEHGSVQVLDADPQASASTWATDAKASGTPLGYPVVAANIATIRAARTYAEDFILIDTPPGDSPTINAAISAADLVLIPTGTSALDMARMWETHDSVHAVAKMILITQAEKRTRLLRQACEAIDSEEDVVRADTIIPKTQAFRRAMGTKVDTKALGEYQALAHELIEATR